MSTHPLPPPPPCTTCFQPPSVRATHPVDDDARPPLHRTHNDFQLGIEAVRTMMEGQVGVTLVVPTLALNGWHKDCGPTFRARIVCASRDGRMVAEAVCDNGNKLDLTSSLCMSSLVEWRPPSSDVLASRKLELTSSKHVHSMRRAEAFAHACAERGVAGARDVVLTLDGNGENRDAMRRVFSSPDCAKTNVAQEEPCILTAEMDPDVALAQAMLYGPERVVFTGGDPHLRVRHSFAGRTHSGAPGVEHLILRPNALLPDGVKARVRALYLDYCGGPLSSACPEVEACGVGVAVLGRLPRLEVFAITMSKRRRPGLLDRFDEHVPTPFGFRVASTFLDNGRVVSKLYVRVDSVPRALRVPGLWWKNCPSSDRSTIFSGTVVGYDDSAARYIVFVPYDDACVRMTANAVTVYSSHGAVRGGKEDGFSATTMSAGQKRKKARWW